MLTPDQVHMTNIHLISSSPLPYDYLYLSAFPIFARHGAARAEGKQHKFPPRRRLRLMRLSEFAHVPTGGISATLIHPLILTAHKTH